MFDNDISQRQRGANRSLDGEFRLRAAVRTHDKGTAEYVNDEVLSLFCSGPAGGGCGSAASTGLVPVITTVDATMLVAATIPNPACLIDLIVPSPSAASGNTVSDHEQ